MAARTEEERAQDIAAKGQAESLQGDGEIVASERFGD